MARRKFLVPGNICGTIWGWFDAEIFPCASAGYMHLLRMLIGQLDRLPPLRLVRGMSPVLVLQNRSFVGNITSNASAWMFSITSLKILSSEITLHLFENPVNCCFWFYPNPLHSAHVNIRETVFDNDLVSEGNNKIGIRKNMFYKKQVNKGN